MSFDLEKPNKNNTEDERENTDRWLISYSDFLTLLFTFFVALYALSTIDQKKAESFSESLNKVFKVIESPIKKDYDEELIKEIEVTLREFQGATVKAQKRGLVITLPDIFLFNSGSAELNKDANKVLDKLAETLRKMGGKISIEGHTDNVPIQSEKIKSNWELSTLRALSVLQYLIDSGIAPERLSATGFGEYQPIADNNTEEGKAKNRRVEIVIIR